MLPKGDTMRRTAVIGVLAAVLAAIAPAHAAANARVAALQVALRAYGLYAGPVDGVAGPLTRSAVVRFQKRRGLAVDGRVGPQTRRALGTLGRPLRGRRELWVGRVGWDVAALEFRLRRWGLSRSAVDGRFDGRTASVLRRFQRAVGLVPDGIAGAKTLSALSRLTAVRKQIHVVLPGESFFSIAQLFRTSPWLLARENGLRLDGGLVPGQRLRLPAGWTSAPAPENQAAVRSALDRWSAYYGVDARLARALAWMESGFQNHVVSPVGARGAMQLLPATWEFVEVVLLHERVPNTADGNVRVGVRYLRWQLDQFGADVRLALAGWYQGARAVRERGLFDDTGEFVSVVLALYGKV